MQNFFKKHTFNKQVNSSVCTAAGLSHYNVSGVKDEWQMTKVLTIMHLVIHFKSITPHFKFRLPLNVQSIHSGATTILK
jgi:hypothetical protein